MIYLEQQFYKLIILNFIMSKKTLSNKTRYSILKLSGFRSRMRTAEGRKTITARRKKGRKRLAIRK